MAKTKQFPDQLNSESMYKIVRDFHSGIKIVIEIHSASHSKNVIIKIVIGIWRK